MHQPNRSIKLSRTVRFAVNPDGCNEGTNGYAGIPAPSGLAPSYEITLRAQGVPEKATGYLVGIQTLDSVARTAMVPLINAAFAARPQTQPATLLPTLWDAAANAIQISLDRISWRLSRYHLIEMSKQSNQNKLVIFRTRFDFAAAHRLHSPELSDEENARFFGKCNNPNGHGHNYQLEPSVAIPLEACRSINPIVLIEHAVQRTLLDQLDHKFLNLDCPWFNPELGGLIPSIENIARVCYEQLAPVIAETIPGASLDCITAWETEKTSAIYPGNADI